MLRRFLLAVASSVALLVLLAWSILAPPFGENHSGANVTEKVVALTFDDGPNPPFTDDLLDLLARENVRASFFMTGEHVTLHPETGRRVVEAGHHVANHGWDHTMLAFQTPNYIRASLERTDRALRSVGVEGPLDFRAARGMRGLQTAWILSRQNRRHYAGTAVGWDWQTQDPDEIAKSVLADVGPGTIIVLHDGYDQADGAYRGGTVEATAKILEHLRHDGYRFVTARELVEMEDSAGD